jgi:hypothetical protein
VKHGGGGGLKINKDQVGGIPVLALFGSWTLEFRESKCFLRGPETLMAMKEQLQKFMVN